MRLYLDTETFSATPIKHGTYSYAADAEVMIVTWAADDGPVQTWDVTAGGADELHDELAFAALEADEVYAHNAMFDRNVLPQLGIDIPLERWRCSMARALAHSLPGSLDKLCDILQVPQDQRKLKAGNQLVLLFCKPQPFKHSLAKGPGETSKQFKARVDLERSRWPGRATRETHPEQWEQFMRYAAMDIEAMRECIKRMPEWNYKGRELALWHLDQRINDRGFAVDVELAEAAVKAIDIEQTRLAGAAWAHTDGALNAATQRDALLEHILTEYGIELPDVRASTIERRLDDPDIPEELKELLRIRLQASTSSTSKYRSLIRGQTGGRLRGTLQFSGAGRTGRWSGRTFQPQNLKRPSMPAEGIEDTIAALKAGTADLI